MPNIKLIAGIHTPEVKWGLIENSWSTNSYLVSEGRTLYIIDSGMGVLHRDRLLTAIAKFPDATRVYLLNTHWHLDHSGNGMILDELDRGFSEVHYLVPEIAKQDIEYFTENTTIYIEIDMGLTRAEWLTEADKQDCHLGGTHFSGWKAEEAYLLSTPGHSNDSLSIYFETEKALFTGDVLWYVNPNTVEGSVDLVLQSAAKLLNLVEETGINYLGLGHFNPIEGTDNVIAYISDYLEKEQALVSSLETAIADSDRVSQDYCLAHLGKSDHPAIQEALRINYPYYPSYIHRFIRVFLREKGWREVDKADGGTWSPKPISSRIPS